MAKRIVVKIGSSLLTREAGALSYEKLSDYASALSTFAGRGFELVLVSSGAIAAGFSALGYAQRPENIAALQASAAVGQGLLMHAYREAFKGDDREVGQLLLTRKDFARRDSYLNALNAIEFLLEKSVIPIVNENDTVTLRQHGFGDNDMLSALVSALIHADMLCILTDTKGMYDKDPKRYEDAKVIRHVPEVTEQLLSEVDTTGSRVGTGGMRAKVVAAQSALKMGVPVYIGSGVGIVGDRLLSIVDGQDDQGTYFGSSLTAQLNRKKQWIAFHSETKGKLFIDEGAAHAMLQNGKSLLPVGITNVQGHFDIGDVLEVYSEDNELLGKGISEYPYRTLVDAIGRKSSFAVEKLGVDRIEVIQRDNWVSLWS